MAKAVRVQLRAEPAENRQIASGCQASRYLSFASLLQPSFLQLLSSVYDDGRRKKDDYGKYLFHHAHKQDNQERIRSEPVDGMRKFCKTSQFLACCFSETLHVCMCTKCDKVSSSDVFFSLANCCAVGFWLQEPPPRRRHAINLRFREIRAPSLSFMAIV